MLFWTIVKVALSSLFANKLRSSLAMLGIIIGVAAVISMLGVGAGAQQQILDRMSAMGTNLIIVRPENRRSRGVASEERQDLTLEDAQAVLEGVPGLVSGAPVVQGTVQVKYFSQNTRTTLLGTAPTYMSIRNYQLAKGRAFTDYEVESLSRVGILGPVTAEALFGEQDPIGESVKVDGRNFLVIGVIEAKGDQGWYNPDDQLIIPYTVAMQQILGADSLREFDLQLAEGADYSQVEGEITEVLRSRHELTAEAEDDFRIRNQAEMVESANSFSQTFTILLGSIASISLLVGGIGIMNIMLVTVTERTREIGVRKALGAKNRDVLRQFLIEAILMSVCGGVLGILLGLGASELIGRFSNFTPLIQPGSVLLSIGFSVGVGVFFGYYPARRAAQLEPIEALRYE